ncbi:hypothetical protein B0H63DRAFT_186533 [Podospora didyma]|uniref:Transcriptional regulator n=1 Tax=Podospora didyma TaxID=330526 RepID=A0AAE0TZX0_9PEZI|nr:hypothetical protein B0H63DRAFT_186533 [Podospora didyma]
MAPKKLSDKALEAELESTVRRIYHGPDKDQLTVNYARQVVEKKLKLQDGFLKEGEWKGKSKDIIKATIDEIESAPDASQAVEFPAKPSATKNGANVKKKRAKKEAAKPASIANTESELSELSDASDASDFSDVSEKPTKKRKVTKAAAKKRHVVLDDEEEAEEPKRKKAKPTTPKTKIVRSRKPSLPNPVLVSSPIKEHKSNQDGQDDSDVLSEPASSPVETTTLSKDPASKVLSGPHSDHEESELSETIDEHPKPKPKPKPKHEGQKPKGAPKPSTVDDESDLSEIDEPLGEVTVKETVRTAKAATDDESEMSEVLDEPPPKGGRKSKPALKGTAKSTPKSKKAAKGTSNAAVDDESEMSDVIDEPPKRKRKSKDPTAPKPERRTKAPAKATVASTLSPDEAQIKQLQGYLLKCGVRKIWAFELKKYGDDNKAKIKRLKDMLAEIGMTGRFSESRAREIKEQRELLAEIEAVKEGEKSWGVGGRPSRRRAAKSFREPSSSDEDEERGGDDTKEEGGSGKDEKATDKSAGSGDDDSEEDDAQPKSRGRGSLKHRADLAFLDDESDSG